MDHGASALNSTFWTFSTTSMDFDFMDKPFSQGSWLQTTDRLNFLESEPFISSVQYDHSKCSSFNTELENLHLVYPDEHVVETATWLVQSEGAELGKRLSIEPNCSVKDRLMLAIEYLKNYVEDSGVLIQIWVPTKKGGQNVLTTIDQPYSLNSTCRSLASYRSVSKTFHLTTEEDSKESAGLPGRVFLRKLPEWTPDVRFFRSDECPRKNYAKLYNISGCLGLPVFEQDSGICLAVVEIVTTTQKINYHLEIEIVCKALEAVDLKSFRDFFPLGVKACNEFYQIASPEISEILQSVCETHSLPLAVTWALCDRQGESECQQFSEKCDNCISTVDSACYVADNDLLGFLEACSEQYLFLDQGIVGKAFTTNTQWFATDITSVSKTKYPLSHHARMFNLRAALAIPLRNMYTGLVEFVLELFLPRDCKDIEEQKHMWDFLPIVIQQALKSFHVIMDKLDDEVNKQTLGIEKFVSYPSKEHIQRNKHFGFDSWECPKEEPEEEFKVVTQWDDNGLGLYQEQIFSEFEELQQSTKLKHCVEGRENSSVGQDCSLSSKRADDKRQAKNEKTISLQILRQYFAGSLKDAAKSIGVCPTTLKRICRQHGINRWPSRKIKKVNHSLRKLQLVVNSIHGAEGLLKIDYSFCKTFPELNSPGKDHVSSFKMSDNSKEHEGGQRSLKVPDSKSQPSSCSQNYGSSMCYSTYSKQPGLNNGCSLPVDDPIIVLNKPRSETELHFLNQEEEKVLERSQIQNCQSLPPLPTGQSLRDGVIFRVKASCGEENIRFSFLPSWGFNDLQQEIARRFKIDNFSRIDLKYLDIDQEPVLLTCDADLEECIDLLKFSQTNTIKISLHQASQPKI